MLHWFLHKFRPKKFVHFSAFSFLVSCSANFRRSSSFFANSFSSRFFLRSWPLFIILAFQDKNSFLLHLCFFSFGIGRSACLGRQSKKKNFGKEHLSLVRWLIGGKSLPKQQSYHFPHLSQSIWIAPTSGSSLQIFWRVSKLLGSSQPNFFIPWLLSLRGSSFWVSFSLSLFIFHNKIIL